MTDPVCLRDVPPNAEFRLDRAVDPDRRRWHVTAETRVLSRDRRGWHRKPCPDAIRVMSRQGATKWLPPGTPVRLLPPDPTR